MCRWELDDPAEPEFEALDHEVQALLMAFMDAAVIVDPIDYPRHAGEPAEPSGSASVRRNVSAISTWY
jgi:hypothetical protein